MELKFFLTLNNKLVSVNDLYKAKIGYSAGRPYPVIYKNPRAVKLSNEMREQMRAMTISEEQLNWLKSNKQYTLYLHAVFKTGVLTCRNCKLHRGKKRRNQTPFV